MATLSEHAERIRAAIEAAEADGFKVRAEVYRVPWDHSEIDEIDLEIKQYSKNGNGETYLANYGLICEGLWE